MTARRILRWLVPGIIAYLVFLCATFPAAYTVRWLKADFPELQLSDVEGSVWSGHAATLTYQSEPLGAVSWQFDWRAPWSGMLGYRISLEDQDTHLTGRVAVGHGGRIAIRELTGRMPVKRLDHWLPLPPDSVDGMLQLNFQNLVVVNRQLHAAEGDIALEDADLNWPENAQLGSYDMQLKTDKDITGVIKDTGGPLILQAQVQLQTNGHYSVTGTLGTRDPNSSAAHLLSYAGSPGPDGRYPISFAGQL